MKTKILSFVAALFAVAIIHTSAFAVEAIGGGSIRVTLPENTAELKIRIYSDGEESEKSIPLDDVLHLSSSKINGMQMEGIGPTNNEFTLEKYKESTGFIVVGDSDSTLVRLTSERSGIDVPLHLDFQWYPKLTILTPAEKVEVLSESGDVLHELGAADPLSLTSSPGMAIRFVVIGADQGGDNQVPTDDGNNLVPAPEAEASGGCHMATGLSGNLGHAWMILLPVAFAAVRRIRRK